MTTQENQLYNLELLYKISTYQHNDKKTILNPKSLTVDQIKNVIKLILSGRTQNVFNKIEEQRDITYDQIQNGSTHLQSNWTKLTTGYNLLLQHLYTDIKLTKTNLICLLNVLKEFLYVEDWNGEKLEDRIKSFGW